MCMVDIQICVSKERVNAHRHTLPHHMAVMRYSKQIHSTIKPKHTTILKAKDSLWFMSEARTITFRLTDQHSSNY